MDLQVHAVHFDVDRKLVEFINSKVNKLENLTGNIVAGEVFLKLDNTTNEENKVAEIKISVPGKDLFARKQCKSFEEATDSACEALRKQVNKYKTKKK